MPFATDPWRTRLAARHLDPVPAPPAATCRKCGASCADLINSTGQRWCPQCGEYVVAQPPCEPEPARGETWRDREPLL